jgi:FkbM family methyltransferase
VNTDEQGLVWVRDRSDKIAVVNESRAHRYRHGIKRRCRHLAQKRYLGSGQVSLTKGDVVFNIGANIGEVSLHFAACGAQVLAFEPDPAARQCLIANTIGTDVEVLPFSVWNESGPLTFYLSTDTADSSAINVTNTKIETQATTIDAIVAERRISRVRLLAGDAEGAEPEILMGATAALKITDFVSLDCSYERRGDQTRDACTELLTQAGFEILRASSKKHLLARRLEG